MRKHILLGAAGAVFGIAIGWASTVRADVVTDGTYGYSIDLPDGWQRIPNDALEQMKSTTVRPGVAAPNFVAAYEPKSHRRHFQYPYLMVQVHPYGGGMDLATVSRKQLDEIVSEITGVSKDKLTSGFSDKAAGLVSNASLDSPTVVTDPPGVALELMMNVQGIGRVHGRSLGLLGRSNAVFVHFYAKDSAWPQYGPMRDQIAAGFHRTPDQAVTLGETTRTTSGRLLDRGFNWRNVFGMATGGAVVGGIVGAIAWIFRRKKSNVYDS